MLKEKGGTYFVVIILKTTTKKQSIEGDLEGRSLKRVTNEQSDMGCFREIMVFREGH